MNGGGPGPAEIGILFAVYGAIFLVMIGIQVFISWLLYRAADSIPEPYREASPGMAYLMLIPLFNLVWIFIYTKQLSQSFQALFSARGQNQGDCGEQIGMWWGICSVVSIVPCVGAIAGIAGLIMMILYLIKVSECRTLALSLGGGGSMEGGFDNTTFTPSQDDNPYGKWD